MRVPINEQEIRSRKTGLTHTKIGRRSDSPREREKRTVQRKPAHGKPSELLTLTEAARLLNVHVNTVRRWGNKGIIATYRVGPRGDRRLRQGDVDKLLRKSKPAKTT